MASPPFKLERDTPGAVNCQCPAFGLSLQRVKVPTGNVHVSWYFGCIKCVENSQTPPVLIGAHCSASASFE